MSTKTILPIEGSWEVTIPSGDTFSSDEVIDAYFKGQQEALENASKLFAKTLEEGVQRCASLSKSVLAYLRTQGFSPTVAFLRINSAFDFDALIGVLEKDFLSDKIIETYSFISDLEEKNNKDFFHISFSISDLEVGFNEEAVFADRFLLKLKDL